MPTIHSHWQHHTDRDDITACIVRLTRPAPWPNHLGEFGGEVYDQTGVVIHRTSQRATYDAAAELLDCWLRSHGQPEPQDCGQADPLDEALDATDGDIEL